MHPHKLISKVQYKFVKLLFLGPIEGFLGRSKNAENMSYKNEKPQNFFKIYFTQYCFLSNSSHGIDKFTKTFSLSLYRPRNAAAIYSLFSSTL